VSFHIYVDFFRFFFLNTIFMNKFQHFLHLVCISFIFHLIRIELNLVEFSRIELKFLDSIQCIFEFNLGISIQFNSSCIQYHSVFSFDQFSQNQFIFSSTNQH